MLAEVLFGGSAAACEDANLGLGARVLPLTLSLCISLAIFLFLRAVFAIKEHRKEAATETSALLANSSSKDIDRHNWVDCCRFWLVAAVVVGHAISFPCAYMPGSKYFLRPWLVWSATFHMPALAFVSGMCSRGPLTQDRMARLWIRIVAPYVFSRVLSLLVQYAFQCHFYGQCGLSDQLSFNGNDGVEWYLASLFVWRLLAPVLLKLRAEVMIALCVGLGVFSGYYQSIITTEIFDFSLVFSLAPRTVAFLPFFAAGLCFHPDVAFNALVRRPHFPQIARVLLLVTLGACFAQARFGNGLAPLEVGAVGDFNFDYVAPRIDPEQPWMYLSPPSCGPYHQFAGLRRAGRYMLSFFAVAIFLSAVPVMQNGIVEAGRHTMYPYLLHSYPLYLQGFLLTMRPAWLAIALGLSSNVGAGNGAVSGNWHDPRSVVLWLGTGLLAAYFTYFATLPCVRQFFSFIIEPSWLMSLSSGMSCSSFKSEQNVDATKKCAV